MTSYSFLSLSQDPTTSIKLSKEAAIYLAQDPIFWERAIVMLMGKKAALILVLRKKSIKSNN